MKILHPILCYYPSQAGGPANTLYWLNNGLNKKFFETNIVSTNYGIAIDTEKIDYGNNQKVDFFESKGKNFIQFSLNAIIETDIVQFSSLFFPPTLLLLFFAKLKNKTIIISPRGELYSAAISQKSFKKRIWIEIIKFFQKDINFHATNDFEKGIIQKFFSKAKRIDVIPNYIQLPQKFDVESKMKFVFVGRINPIKNIDILIESFCSLKQLKPELELELEIVGSARLNYEIEYLRNLKDQIKKLSLEGSVKFMGHLDGDEKNKIIASSFALVLPSKSENFGNVVLEALAQGTPVIASKNTPWKILEDYNSGYWVEVNKENLMESMNSIVNLNEIEYKKMRDNAFSLCKSNFNIQTNIHVWENYYKSISTYVQK